MKSKLFKFLPLVLFSLAVSASAETTPGGQSSCYDQGHPAPATEMMSGYNAPARIDVKGSWDFFLTASFTYWQPKMDGLALGEVAFIDINSIPFSPGKIINTDFDFKPGFKVGLGLNSGFDNWTLYAEYTWVHVEDNTHFSVPSLGIGLPAYWAPGDAFTAVSSEWEHHNNIVDLDLGRSFYVGTHLTFFPFVGARAYWIDQDLEALYTISPTTNNFAFADADSWAIGARAGIQTSWLLGKEFRLIGNAAASLAYQKFKSFYKALNAGVLATAIGEDRHSQITPNAETAVGLGWGSYFGNKSWYFDLSALYEFHFFWNQNRMYALLAQSQGTPSTRHNWNSEDLMYQGLTVTARFDF